MSLNTELIKGFLLGALLISIFVLAAFLIYRELKPKSQRSVDQEAIIITKSIENVSKLVLVESHMSEVYTYRESDKVFFNLIPTEKKAIILLKAKVQISYDLKKMKINIDKQNRTITIVSIPAEEVVVEPDVKFYDIQSSTFGSFKTEDINKVQLEAKSRIYSEVEKSGLKLQAKRNLQLNLQSLFAVSEGIGWTVIDQTQSILPATVSKVLN